MRASSHLRGVEVDEDRKRVCMEEKGNLEILFDKQLFFFLAKTGT